MVHLWAESPYLEEPTRQLTSLGTVHTNPTATSGINPTFGWFSQFLVCVLHLLFLNNLRHLLEALPPPQVVDINPNLRWKHWGLRGCSFPEATSKMRRKVQSFCLWPPPRISLCLSPSLNLGPCPNTTSCVTFSKLSPSCLSLTLSFILINTSNSYHMASLIFLLIFSRSLRW